MAYGSETWAALVLASLSMHCAADGEPSCEDLEPGACPETDVPIGGTEEGLSQPAWWGRHLLEVEGIVVGEGGSVEARAASLGARCRGARCYALRGASVTLEAIPDEGRRFSHWSGCSDGTEATLTLRHLQASTTCSAHFAIPARLDLLHSGGDATTRALDVSDDGNVVAGVHQDAQGTAAFRWTPTEGMSLLPGAQGTAAGVSPDGRYVVGSVSAPDNESGRAAAVWQLGAEPRVIVGTQPIFGASGPRAWFVNATGARNDGRLFVTCLQYGAYGQPIGCQRDATGYATFERLSYIHDGDDAGTLAGSVFLGSRGQQGPYASAAYFAGAQLPYPSSGFCSVSDPCESTVTAFSTSQPPVVVGTARVPPPGTITGSPRFSTAFTYTGESGTVRLPDLAGGLDESGANAISGDGRLIAGFGTADRGQVAVVWVDGTPIPLETLLRDAGTQQAPDVSLLVVTSMSPDGRAYVGDATTREGVRAYRVVLPSAPGAGGSP